MAGMHNDTLLHGIFLMAEMATQVAEMKGLSPAQCKAAGVKVIKSYTTAAPGRKKIPSKKRATLKELLQQPDPMKCITEARQRIIEEHQQIIRDLAKELALKYGSKDWPPMDYTLIDEGEEIVLEYDYHAKRLKATFPDKQVTECDIWPMDFARLIAGETNRLPRPPRKEAPTMRDAQRQKDKSAAFTQNYGTGAALA